MPVSSLWMLEKSNITVSGGGSLDGISQGSGVHLVGRTITLNTPAWKETFVNDNDANFDDNDAGQTLSGAQTINGVTYVNGTIVEAEYVLNLQDPVSGRVYQVIGYNIRNSNPAYATIEGLAFVGPQRDWPPVGRALNVVSNAEGPGGGSPTTTYASYVTPPCFTPGVRIRTDQGLRPVEDLKPGDRVFTRQAGFQAVKTVARTHLSHARLVSEPWLCPVRIKKGSLGRGRPRRDVVASPQHRFVVTHPSFRLLFDTAEVLVAAKDLAHAIPLSPSDFPDGLTYVHLILADHHIIVAEGAATESYLPGPVTAPALQAELAAIFRDAAPTVSALPSLRGWEARLAQA
jgi:hypothetical protein